MLVEENLTLSVKLCVGVCVCVSVCLSVQRGREGYLVFRLRVRQRKSPTKNEKSDRFQNVKDKVAKYIYSIFNPTIPFKTMK